MKRLIYLFLTLFTAVAYGQADFPEGVQISGGQPTTTTDPYITTTGATGLQGKVPPINMPVTITPPTTFYTPVTSDLKGHLQGIDNALGDIPLTTAGNTTRVWFTGDATTIGAGTFYLTNATNKGTVANVSQSVTNDDNQKKYFAQDLIGNAFATTTIFPPGVYAGNLSASTTPNSAQQRFTVELYKCDTNGTPIASGIAGAPVGDLGVTVILILDSGLLTLADGSVTNVQVSASLASQLTINVGERIRYHVSAEKVGTIASNITESVWYGNSFNSFLDVPTPITSSGVSNLSTVTGATVTTALDNLKTADQAVAGAGVTYGHITDAAQNIDGNKTFLKYLITKASMAGSNPYFMRFQDEITSFDLVTIGEVGLSNHGPAIKLIGRDITESPEIFIGHNVTRNYGWLFQSQFSNATFTLNRRNAGVDFSVYTIDNSNGNFSLGTVDTSHKLNVGGSANIQGVLSTDQNVVANYYATATEATAGTTGAFRTQNNTGVVSRNAANNANMTLIKSNASNAVVISEEGWNVSVNGNTSINANLLVSSLSGTGTRTVVADASGNLSATATPPARPYLVYVALISQSGTSAPTATVLENTFGGTVTWTRSATGVYHATTSSIFTSGKTFFLDKITNGSSENKRLNTLYVTPSDIQYASFDSAGTLSDGVMLNTPVEIRVYP